jgi:hypothetical protein
MVREYYPCVKLLIDNIFLENNYINKDYNKIIHPNFCTHKNTRGKYISELCLSKSSSCNNLCIRHNLKELNKCNGVNNRNKKCNRNVKKESLYCNYCVKKKSYFYNISKNIFNLNILDFNISNKDMVSSNNKLKHITKYLNLREFIKNRYYILLNCIKNISYKYNVSMKFVINILFIFFKLSKNDKKHQIHLTQNISLNNLNSIDCVKLMQYIGYTCINDGKRFRFETDIFNIVITDNILFFDNKTRYGNIGAINLYKYITNKNIVNAIKDLKIIWNNIDSSDKKFNKTINNKKHNKDNNKINNPVPNEFIENIETVKNYLINFRKLDKDIIYNMVKDKLISSDKFKNCIFYNKEKTTAYLRGTNINNRFFKATGKMDFIIYNFGDGPLHIFESPIDCISYYQIYKINGVYASTNGSTLININKINSLIDKYNNYKITYLCFDNDEAGDNFTNKIKSNINNKFIRILPKNKDWNEELMNSI